MNTWAPFAEVVVDVPNKAVNRGFHYAIPEELAGRVVPGMRVLVPFGNRPLEGYVLRLTEHSPVDKIKNITKVVDAQPLFTPQMLELAQWMADFYMCTIVEVLQCMMPTGIKMEGQKILALTAAGQAVLEADTNQGYRDEEIKLLEYLSQKGDLVSVGLLVKEHGKSVMSLVNRLVKGGLIQIETVMTSKIGKKFRQVIKLNIERDQLGEYLAQLAIRAPKQAQVLAEVAASEAMTATELASAAQTTSATVRAMIDKGVLVPVQEVAERDPYATKNFAHSKPMVPTTEQAMALQQIYRALDTPQGAGFLIHGVTGSGKTEIYLQAIAKVLAQSRQAIVLVPEISLTPQMVSRFKGRFGQQVAVLHSRLSLGERYDEWRKIKENRVSVVVGARSAIFAPFTNLGLIIIDEEHEGSYKQDEKPRYHAREVAAKRARLEGATLILGSATPAIESYYAAQQGELELITLHQRIQARPMPEVRLIDLREELRQGNRTMFSGLLREKIQDRLDKKEQTILFLNRRGYSTFVICRECGLVMKCPDCDISLTYHRSGLLQCHYCNHQEDSPDICPKCGSKYIRFFGVGTQKVEEELHRAFPEARVQRMDVDTTSRKGAHERILEGFERGDTDILIGTQMIAKGLDFPNVTLVGVITADTAINLPDFRSGERTFQLLTQVAGRAGRADKIGESVVQTYTPDHYSIIAAQQHDYVRFYQEEIDLRRMLAYPPFSYLIKVVVSGEDEQQVIKGAEALKLDCHRDLPEQVEILGPAPAPLSKIKKRFRWHLAIKSPDIALAQQAIRLGLNKFEERRIPGLRVTVDVNPQSML